MAGLPLYRVIEQDLRGRITSGEVPVGSRIETELELMQQYGVARSTVRQALGRLVADGLLEIRRGAGTFVAAPRFEHTIGGFYSLSREIESLGLQPGTVVLGLASEKSTESVASHLGVELHSRVVALRRLRLAGGEPLAVETSYLPAGRFPGLERVDFTNRRLYDTLATDYGVRTVRARETFAPVVLGEDEAGLLVQQRGSPALRVERIAFDQEDVPVEFCLSTIRGDRYRYVVELR